MEEQEAVTESLDQELDNLVDAHSATALKGAPKTLAEAWGISAPQKLKFEECYKEVLEKRLLLVPAQPIHVIAPSQQQTADLLDMPLTAELPTGVASAFAFEPSSVRDVLVARRYEDLPAPLHSTARVIDQYSMDLHCIKTAADKRAVVKHLHLHAAVKAPWAKSTFETSGSDDGVVLFATRGQTHPKHFVKALHMMLDSG